MNQLNNVALFVVRYFGGTKLGAGRLLRTYVDAGTLAVNKCDFYKIIDGYKFKCKTGYEPNGKICRQCPTGQYSDQNENGKCKSCPAGTYNSRSGMTSSSACITCPKATDVWVDSGRTTLAQGTSTAGSTTCWLAPGTYYDETGQFEITDNNCTY